MKVWILEKNGCNVSGLSLRLLTFVYELQTEKKFDKNLLYYNKIGKPFYSDFYFNISHSDNYICLVISNFEVGIDVEEKRKLQPKVIRKVCHKSEICDNLDVVDMWTFKEAYSKYLGLGVTIDFSEILRKDVEKELVTTNLSTANYYCYVVGKEKVDEIILSSVKDILSNINNE